VEVKLSRGAGGSKLTKKILSTAVGKLLQHKCTEAKIELLPMFKGNFFFPKFEYLF
jgi:hypothetical protein